MPSRHAKTSRSECFLVRIPSRTLGFFCLYPFSSEKLVPVQDELVKFLSSYVTDGTLPHGRDAALISLLKIRDTLGDPNRLGGMSDVIDKYKEAYPQLKTAFDKIESERPDLKKPRKITVRTSH